MCIYVYVDMCICVYTPDIMEKNFLKIAELYVKYGVPQWSIRRWVWDLKKKDFEKYRQIIKEDKIESGIRYLIDEAWFKEKMIIQQRKYNTSYETPEIAETELDHKETEQKGAYTGKQLSAYADNQIYTENIELKTKLAIAEKENEKKDKTIEEKDNKINAICLEAGKWKGQYNEIRYLLAEVKKHNQPFDNQEQQNEDQRPNPTTDKTD